MLHFYNHWKYPKTFSVFRGDLIAAGGIIGEGISRIKTKGSRVIERQGKYPKHITTLYKNKCYILNNFKRFCIPELSHFQDRKGRVLITRGCKTLPLIMIYGGLNLLNLEEIREHLCYNSLWFGEILFDSFQMTSFCIVKMKLSRRILFNVKNSRMTYLKTEFTLTVLKVEQLANYIISLNIRSHKRLLFFSKSTTGRGSVGNQCNNLCFFFTIYLKSKSVKATALDLTIFSRNHEFQVF